MTPTRPYFVQAIFDWVLDNDLTPFLSVYADYPTTVVPLEYVDDGQITLNIAPSAVHSFYMDKEAISFQARFSGQSMSVYVPMGAIMGLYAKENGHGMAFPEEPFYQELAESLLDAADASEDGPQLASVSSSSSLDADSDQAELELGGVSQEDSKEDGPNLDASGEENTDSKKESGKKSSSKVSHLRVIK